MKSFEHDKIMYEQGVEQGRQAEMKNTEKERELTRHLLKDKRYKDIERAMENGSFRGKLLEEYKIK